jgi:hypothetical protein
VQSLSSFKRKQNSANTNHPKKQVISNRLLVDEHTANLQVSTLRAASNKFVELSDLNKYAQNGRDPARIRRILSGQARCCDESCKQKCPERISEGLLQKLCDAYWRLPVDEQAWLVQRSVCAWEQIAKGIKHVGKHHTCRATSTASSKLASTRRT